MPTDYLFHGLTQPFGFLLIVAGILVPFLFWRRLLGEYYKQIGMAPLALAYTCALLGFAIIVFWSAYTTFSARALDGGLLETARWSTVPRWTMYLGVIWLPFVLLMLALIGVPVATQLIKSSRLTYRNIATRIVVFWLAFTGVLWGFATAVNGWHDPKSPGFFLILVEVLPGIALIAAPFLLAIYLASRRKLHREPSGLIR